MRNFFVSVYVILTLGLYGCGENEKPEPDLPRPVVVHTVEEPSAITTRSFSGQVSAPESALSFEVKGRIQEIEVKAGDEPAKGDVVARLDPEDYETRLRDAEAQKKEADSQLTRTQRLFETGNASQSQLESAIAAAKRATANYDSVSKQLEDTVLNMPYDGKIGRVIVNEQEVVAAGQAIVTLLNEAKGMEFEFGIPPELVNRIEIDGTGKVQVPSADHQKFTATITEIGAEPSSNTTYPVTLSLKGGGNLLRNGMDGEVFMDLRQTGGSTIRVPLSCVGAKPGGQPYVFVLDVSERDDEAKVRMQEVTTGKLVDDGRIEILEGLEAGTRIVAKGVNRLRPGVVVSTEPSEISF